MNQEEIIKLLKWVAKKDYVWMKKYPNGEILWQERRPGDSVDVWSLPLFTTEQLCEQYINQIPISLKLLVQDKFNIIGRGTVYTNSLKANNINKENLSTMINKEVEIEGNLFLVKGIETVGYSDTVGLLVRELNTK